MKKFLKWVAIVITALVILFTVFFVYISKGLDANSQPQVAGADASLLADGVYPGSYEGGRWTNQVNVTVVQGKITDITPTQKVTFDLPAVFQELTQKVIAQQTTLVDTVAGATVTSKAYLKAIENALTQQ